MSRDRTLVLVLGLVLAATLTGCGQGEDGGESSGNGATTTGLDPGDCKGGETAPFTVEELLEGLRAAGYGMYVDPGCSSKVAAWALSNTSIHVPELEPDDFGPIQKREGAVACYLYDGQAQDVGAKVTVLHYEGEAWTTLRTRNVSCDITPDPVKEQEQVDRLEESLNKLAASQS
jgi:hypothetical protein